MIAAKSEVIRAESESTSEPDPVDGGGGAALVAVDPETVVVLNLA